MTVELMTPKSIGIIYGSWLTNTWIMGFLSWIAFMLFGEQGFYVQGHCDLDLWPTDPKINVDHLWVMAIHDTKTGLPTGNKFEVNERTLPF